MTPDSAQAFGVALMAMCLESMDLPVTSDRKSVV